MNRMKAEGYRAGASYIKMWGRDEAREMLHRLILDNRGRECAYTQGFLNQFNKTAKTLDNTNRK